LENDMTLNILDNRGMPLDRQRFTWRDMVQKPISKLDDDAYTRTPTLRTPQAALSPPRPRLPHPISSAPRTAL
jgi:hypothetical protein